MLDVLFAFAFDRSRVHVPCFSCGRPGDQGGESTSAGRKCYTHWIIRSENSCGGSVRLGSCGVGTKSPTSFFFNPQPVLCAGLALMPPPPPPLGAQQQAAEKIFKCGSK
ncbi:unnamed protein product, partial [Discosporangium mesarthrocarpum]